MRALEIAAAGMQAQQMRVEVISNNLANMNTTAYNPAGPNLPTCITSSFSAPARSAPRMARSCRWACSLASGSGRRP